MFHTNPFKQGDRDDYTPIGGAWQLNLPQPEAQIAFRRLLAPVVYQAAAAHTRVGSTLPQQTLDVADTIEFVGLGSQIPG